MAPMRPRSRARSTFKPDRGQRRPQPVVQVTPQPSPLLFARRHDPAAAPREQVDLEEPIPDDRQRERDRDRQAKERGRVPLDEGMAGQDDRQRQQAHRRDRREAERQGDPADLPSTGLAGPPIACDRRGHDHDDHPAGDRGLDRRPAADPVEDRAAGQPRDEQPENKSRDRRRVEGRDREPRSGRRARSGPDRSSGCGRSTTRR